MENQSSNQEKNVNDLQSSVNHLINARANFVKNIVGALTNSVNENFKGDNVNIIKNVSSALNKRAKIINDIKVANNSTEE